MAASIGNKHTYTISLIDGMCGWSMVFGMLGIINGAFLGINFCFDLYGITRNLALTCATYAFFMGFMITTLVIISKWKKACKLLGRDYE